MDLKTLFGLVGLPGLIAGSTLVACVSKRVRDLYFVLLVFTAPLLERMSVNFVSREWYRGTSRGFEVCLPDILAVSLLLSSVLAPRRGEGRAYWPPSFGWMLLFFGYACVNVALATPQLFGYFELFKLVRGMVVVLAVAFYLRSERELRLLIFALGLMVCYEGLVALKQRYVDGYHRVPGTIDDPNSLSVLFCTTAPVLVAAFNSRLPVWLRGLSAAGVLLASIGIILTISRAGVVIMGLVLFGSMLASMSYRVTGRKIALALVVVVGAVGITAKAWNSLVSRFTSASLHEEYAKSRGQNRGYYIRLARAITAEQWLGVGLNNWSYWVSNRYGPKLGFRFVPYKGTDRAPSTVVPPGHNVDEAQAAPAHNLGALTAGELGLPGLILFLLIWMRWFQMGASFLWPRTPDPMRRVGIGLLFGCGGIFLQSFTEWVFRQSPIYFTFHILLGALASLYFMKRQPRPAEAVERASQAQARPEAVMPVDQPWIYRAVEI